MYFYSLLDTTPQEKQCKSMNTGAKNVLPFFL